MRYADRGGELNANAAEFFPLCFRVAMAIIGGKRTCGLRCSTISSSLPLVTEPRETGQPVTGQGQLRHGYHRTRRVRREITHSQGGSPGGRLIVRLRHFPGHCTWGEARHEGGSRDGGLRACARDSSGLFLVLNLVSPCKVASGTAPDRVLVRCGLHRCRQLRRRGEAAR